MWFELGFPPEFTLVKTGAGIDMSNWLIKEHENTNDSPFGKGGCRGIFRYIDSP